MKCVYPLNQEKASSLGFYFCGFILFSSWVWTWFYIIRKYFSKVSKSLSKQYNYIIL